MKHSDISLKILGGGHEIGANCYLLEWGKYNIILDSGMDPRKSGYEALPALDMLHKKEIDAVIISHAHLDHIGSLPFLTLSYLALGGKVFVSPPNMELVPHMLMESVKAVERGRIPEEEQYYYHQFSDRYLVRDMKKTGGVFSAVDYNTEFEPVPGIKAMFFQAGHVLGSAGILLTDGDYTLVYTGDICLKDQIILSGCNLPGVKKTDCLIIESTHGSTPTHDRGNRKDEYLRLAEEIKKTFDRQGHVLIPCFGLGRTQDMVVMLSHMKKEGLIPESVPVFHHYGLTAGVNEIYDRFPDYLINMEAMAISACSKGQNGYYGKGKFKKAGELSKQPAIFVFTSGMMVRGTPAAFLAGELVQSDANGIFFCGYIAPGELGYELANITTGEFICLDIEKQDWVKVVCPHIHTFSFSAHASRQDLLKIAEHFNPDIAVWVHGDASSTKWLSQSYADVSSPAVYSHAPQNRETIALRIGTNRLNRPLKEFKSVLVTVGTSLLSTFLKRSGRQDSDYGVIAEDELQSYIMTNLHDLPSLSAETNSLNRKGLEPADFLYFICGDNKQGRMCGNILKKLYEGSHLCRLVEVEGLRPESRVFRERGMKHLLEQIVGVIEDHGGNAVIHATGGFKAQIALATLLGILFKNEVYYLYEDFQEIVRLPEIPLDFDFQALFAHKGQFFTLMDGREYWRMDEIYARLPEMLKPCFYKDEIQKKYNLTPLGRGIFSSFQRYMGQKGMDIPIAVKGESALWGEEHDSISQILNPVIGMIMERLNRYRDLIKAFEFSSVKKRSGSKKQKNETYLELIAKDTDKLIYRINHVAIRKGIEDTLTISTVSGAVSYLLNMLGRKIYP